VASELDLTGYVIILTTKSPIQVEAEILIPIRNNSLTTSANFYGACSLFLQLKYLTTASK
jgi:hypothetical protein